MDKQSMMQLPLPGSSIRIIYSSHGLDMFSIGSVLCTDSERIVFLQNADQYGPLEPSQVSVPWPHVIRLAVVAPPPGKFIVQSGEIWRE
jgi:hypothetical protein